MTEVGDKAESLFREILGDNPGRDNLEKDICSKIVPNVLRSLRDLRAL